MWVRIIEIHLNAVPTLLGDVFLCSTEILSTLLNILEAVRNRTTLAENRAKEQIKELRVHAIDTLTRLKTLDKQVLQLETYLKEVNDTFLATKQELNKEYTNQKTIIDNQIEGLGTEKSTVLEDESKRLDKKISDNINNKLVPQMRGLGDGFVNIDDTVSNLSTVSEAEQQ
ncbi:unnamed protein product [Medioppia subpectinata]|uniref:Uncharacterized protein n=1 Tax=Medioppia subpectinata TaxID=1979941 RepID=A0A7R9PV72_9ACAR|nr:unnamed protein product [Medioppia subpectinata]CAG2102521.1 unnamed protein product [Medioppia subpectinata]